MTLTDKKEMIASTIHKNVSVPITDAFNVIKNVSSYKDFVPWCRDSWESNKENLNFFTKESVYSKFPQLEQKKLCRDIINQKLTTNGILHAMAFDGGLTVGFNFLDVSYVSRVLLIKPNIILSLTDGTTSNVFKQLEGLWILTEYTNTGKDDLDIAKNLTTIEYSIKFEFKSVLYSTVTNLFLSFIRDNILNSFENRYKYEANRKHL